MKKIIYLFTTLVFLCISCSSDGDSSGTSNHLIKKTIINDGRHEFAVEYIYEGNKLVRENSGSPIDGGYTLYTYEGDLITRTVQHIVNESFSHTIETIREYDSSQRLKGEVILYAHNNTAERFAYTYNADGTVSAQQYYGDLTSQNTFNYSQKFWLNSSGEPVKIVEYRNDEVQNTTVLTYDSKNNIFKNTVGFNKTLFRKEGTVHNVLSKKVYNENDELYYGAESFQFTYNIGNYPVACSTSSGIITTNSQYFYE